MWLLLADMTCGWSWRVESAAMGVWVWLLRAERLGGLEVILAMEWEPEALIEFGSIPRVSVPKLGRAVMTLGFSLAPAPPPNVPDGGEYIGSLITLSEGNKGVGPPT